MPHSSSSRPVLSSVSRAQSSASWGNSPHKAHNVFNATIAVEPLACTIQQFVSCHCRKGLCLTPPRTLAEFRRDCASSSTMRRHNSSVATAQSRAGSLIISFDAKVSLVAYRFFRMRFVSNRQTTHRACHLMVLAIEQSTLRACDCLKVRTVERGRSAG